MSILLNKHQEVRQEKHVFRIPIMGKQLIIIGLVIAAIGVIFSIFQPSGIPKIPGDIHIQRENFTFYFPLGWCIVISVSLSLLFWLFGK